jgi:hypothetical protein
MRFARCNGLPRSWLLLAAACLSLLPSPASARGRGSYRRYQQVMRKQMQVMQKEQQEWQKQVKANEEAFLKRFDTNHNGKIDGKEKAPAKKYLRQLELGIDPDKSLKSMGRRTPSDTSSKPAQKHRPASSRTPPKAAAK